MKGLWVNELPAVLWFIKMTKKSATRETLFMLVYILEVVFSFEVVIHTLIAFQEIINNQALREALDLLPRLSAMHASGRR